MAKHNGYDLVRPMFTSGKLKVFKDIFKLVPKSVVAADLGKEKGRFNRLIEDPDDFIYQEIRLFSTDCDLAPFEMGMLIETEHPGKKPEADQQKAFKYGAMRPMFEQKKIEVLEDIFKYIPKSTVAANIRKKRDRFNHLMNHVEDFSVKDIRAIGVLCELTLPEMFQLVEAQYTKQKNNKAL